MSDHDESDPLSDLLSSVSLPADDPARREAIFAQTRGVLWQRRTLRRSAWVAALVGCYLVGALSVLAWQAGHPQPEIVRQPAAPVENKTPAVAEVPQPNVEQSASSPEDPTHTLDEPKVVVAPPEAALSTFEKLRRAGDRQLNQRGNLQGAIGCYRRALDSASDEDLQIVPARDSWLLISLKEARLESRKHDDKRS